MTPDIATAMKPITKEEAAAVVNLPVAGQEEGTLITPVPEDAPECNLLFDKHYGNPVKLYRYCNMEGAFMMLIARYERINRQTTEREKLFRPFTCYQTSKGIEWRCKNLPENRPLYGAELLQSKPAATVMITEGEKACEAARQLFPDIIALSPSGGSNAVRKTDWTPLAGRKVIIWGDADDAGTRFALDVKTLCFKHGALAVGVMPIPEQWHKGFDAADLLASGYQASDAVNLLQGIQFTSAKTQIPPQYSLKADGVYFDPDPEHKEKPEVHVCGFLEILATTCDEGNQNFGRLIRFKATNGHMHELAIAMEWFASDGKELRAFLLNRGFYINPPQKHKLSNYVQLTKPVRTAKSISRIGWHDGSFVLPDCVFPDMEDIYLQNATMVHHAFNQRGTLEEWKTHIGSYIASNSRLTLAACAAFAAPLLRLINAESGGFHLRGNSSIGKSTALFIAASIWGGDKDNGFIYQWRATANALEATAESRNDCLLCLDEMGQVDGREAGEVAYMLANESGKGRMSKDAALKKPRSWKLLFLSTGELTLQEKMHEAGKRTHAGMETRLVDIPADAGKGFGIFDTIHTMQDGSSLSQHLRDASQHYYGSAAREFLTHLTRENAQNLSATIEHYRREYVQWFKPHQADGQVIRVIHRFGLLYAAGELAIRYHILPFSSECLIASLKECMDAWLESRGTLGDLETIHGIEQVKQFFRMNGDSRFSIIRSAYDNLTSDEEIDQSRQIHQRVGYKRRDSKGYWQYLVYPESFKHVICSGRASDKIAKALAHLGMLEPAKDGRIQQVIKLPKPDAKVSRMLVFNHTVLES